MWLLQNIVRFQKKFYIHVANSFYITLYLVGYLIHLIQIIQCLSSDGWESRWVKSDWKKDENMAGEWNYTSGKWNGDANDKGKPFCAM